MNTISMLQWAKPRRVPVNGSNVTQISTPWAA
ncbi:MAG: hypothetical protein K0Q76_2000 [Panacagrimonas sp.]|jgi:hypothetical protein|nr:hypothetical protein [Panacagrimonas sp.]